jgi:hypothetical protein
MVRILSGANKTRIEEGARTGTEDCTDASMSYVVMLMPVAFKPSIVVVIGIVFREIES